MLDDAQVLDVYRGDAGASDSGGPGTSSGSSEGGGDTVRILSGSENQELEEIIEDCADKAGVRIEMDYKGSVDIMRELQSGADGYDAVWPASSMWISLGDTGHLVKHSQSVSLTPVVFGIRQSLAEELGFIGSCIIIALLLLIVIQCILIGIRSQNLSGRIICCGVGGLIGIQSFINIGVATQLIPNTGVPLPFVSYGLTSLVSLYIGIGLVLNVGLQPKKYQ